MKKRKLLLCLAALAFLSVTAQHTPTVSASSSSLTRKERLNELRKDAFDRIGNARTKNEDVVNESYDLIEEIYQVLLLSIEEDEKLLEENELNLAKMRGVDSIRIAYLDSVTKSKRETYRCCLAKLEEYDKSAQKEEIEDLETRINACEQEFLHLIQAFVIHPEPNNSTLIRRVKAARDLMGDRLDPKLRSQLGSILKEDTVVTKQSET